MVDILVDLLKGFKPINVNFNYNSGGNSGAPSGGVAPPTTGKDRALVAVGGVLGIAALWYAAPRLYDFLKAKAAAEVNKWVKNADAEAPKRVKKAQATVGPLLDPTGSVLPTTAEAAKVTKQLPPAVLEKPKPKAD
eukprot:scaffold88086_cov67-Phaeocystis_antarctica.AAC.2